MDSPSVIHQSVDPDRIPRIKLANDTPKQVWWFMATFIGLVALGHFISLWQAHATRNRPRQPQTSSETPLRSNRILWGRVPLALLNVYRTIVFRWAIAINFLGAYTINMADFLLAGVYFTVLFCWTFVNTTNLEGMKYDPKYWANRCVHIAAVQLPLMAALGMKNNPISYLTGVSFDKLEHLHRATARVLVVMFWVHGAGRLILPHGEDTTTYWFRIGTAGTTALTLLAIMSVRPIRVRTHEWFMYAHTVLGVLGLAGAYIHSAEFGYPYLVWPALFVWGLDRVLRLIRVVLVNSQLIQHTPKRITSRATVSVLPNPGFVRILVEAPHYMVWQPAQSMYLTLVGAYTTSITESHPFTIANVPGWGALLDETEEKKETGSSEEVQTNPSAAALSNKKLLFILRVRTGFTRRLRDSVLSTPDENAILPNSKSFPAFLDGPYSSPPDVRGFDSVLFVCGGSGVSFALPLFLDILHAASQGKNPCCSRVVFVWAIRDRDQVDWITDTLVRALTALRAGTDLQELDIDVRVHVTASAEYTQSTEPVDAETEAGVVDQKERETDSEKQSSLEDPAPTTTQQRLWGLSGVQLIHGRPDLDVIVSSEIARMRGGAISINVCGTTELTTSVRYALSNPVVRFRDVVRGGPSVLFHIEGFGNA
ncbi:ferric reductase NAD binding domain-containing protein [Mycena amicta]|nr:ferric reductase NAD binding domain-containing protein [Mycena amicta]